MLDHPRLKSVLRVLPGVVAAALALIYVVGSLNAAGALAREGISVTAVRLFSLEQLLVRGVSVFTQPDLLFLVALLILANVFLARVLARRGSSGQQKWIGSALFLAWIGTVIIALVSPWRVGATFGASTLIMVLLGLVLWHENPEERRKRAPVLLGLWILCVFLIANYFVNFPQPTARIVREDRPPITGVFITHSDGAWYIAGEGNGAVVRPVPDREVVSATLFYDDTPAEPSIGTLILREL